MIKLTLEVDKQGFADMDQLQAMVLSLPRVQQALLHARITDQFMVTDPRSEMAQKRAEWLYAQTKL